MNFTDEYSAHPLWEEFFVRERNTISEIFDCLPKSSFVGFVCPRRDLVFRFASFNPQNLRVVILGQDPYPQPNVATGRSFEVAELTSWSAPFRQVSLKNILRAIYKAYTGDNILWSELRPKIEDGSFDILPPNELFDSLEGQGVLFLNAYLTCMQGAPLSQKKLWRPFSERLITYIDSSLPNRTNTAWFLWGKDARSFSPLIKNGTIYASRHPMLCGDYDDDFLNNPCFAATMNQINWKGFKTND